MIRDKRRPRLRVGVAAANVFVNQTKYLGKVELLAPTAVIVEA